MPAALSAAEIPRYCEITSTGQTRDPTNPLDTRCSTGFLCGVAFVKGPLCCMRLCMCKDFLGPAVAPTPIACQGDAAATCE